MNLNFFPAIIASSSLLNQSFRTVPGEPALPTLEPVTNHLIDPGQQTSDKTDAYFSRHRAGLSKCDS